VGRVSNVEEIDRDSSNIQSQFGVECWIYGTGVITEGIADDHSLAYLVSQAVVHVSVHPGNRLIFCDNVREV